MATPFYSQFVGEEIDKRLAQEVIWSNGTVTDVSAGSNASFLIMPIVLPNGGVQGIYTSDNAPYASLEGFVYIQTGGLYVFSVYGGRTNTTAGNMTILLFVVRNYGSVAGSTDPSHANSGRYVVGNTTNGYLNTFEPLTVMTRLDANDLIYLTRVLGVNGQFTTNFNNSVMRFTIAKIV